MKNEETLLSPASGHILDITKVHDPMFSEKAMGDGFGVIPNDDVIEAPLTGKIMLVAPTKHAIGIAADNGLEVLIHMGVDTVELNGTPFEIDVSEGDVVHAGQKIATMDFKAVEEAGKATDIIIAITNTAKMVSSVIANVGDHKAGTDGAVVKLLAEGEQNENAHKTTSGKVNFDDLAKDIVKNIGGAENVDSVIHCITRVRFYLKDEKKANDEAIENLNGVLEVAKAGGQYQVVIGPKVEEAFDAVVKVLGPGFGGDGDAAPKAPKRKAPKGVWPKTKFYFSSLIGVITASMMPVIGLLAAAGILVGFTAARRLGANQIIVAVVGGVLAYPTLVQLATKTASSQMNINASFLGIPIHVANYTYSIFPMIAAAWLAAEIEPWLKKHINASIRMIVSPLVEVFVVSAVILVIVGPIITFLSSLLASGIVALLKFSPALSGLVIGGFYQCLVIFGLHWAVIPVVANQIATTGHSALNAIVSATMVAQGAAVLAVFLKTKKNPAIKQIAGAATLSAFSGITEPAMYGINLKYGRVFWTANIGGAVGGFLTGLFHVDMWGFAGSFIGFASFINPKGIDASFTGYLIASAAALIVAFTCTYFFGFKESDLDQKVHTVEKVRLGSRAPAVK